MTRKAYRTIESIPGIARKGESIVIDPENFGILVARWVPWSEYDHLMKHESSLCADPEYSPPIRRKQRRRSVHLRVM